MATQRGQQLRNYINQFSEILVTNRKLDIEAGINRVQEQVAKGLVTPPTDEPLKDNRLYNEAWREARAENLGRDAGQSLMDDAGAMVAESMEGFRFDDDKYSPSEKMTYLVDEWWKKHKTNVGDTDLAFHPAYQKQWETYKTRALGALRDVVQTETVKQATGEARSVIQDRLSKLVTAIGPGDFDAPDAPDAPSGNSKSYKGIRDELLSIKYPLLQSQLEGLIHDEVNSQGMNILNDPLSTDSEWVEALGSIQALDEPGFANNGMSLSEIITGDKTPESEASTKAIKLFQARIKQQNVALTKEGKETQEQNYKKYQAMSREMLKKQEWATIVEEVPGDKVTTMRNLFFKAEDTEQINEGAKSRLDFASRYMDFKTKKDLETALLKDPVLRLTKWKESYDRTVQGYIDFNNEGVRISGLEDLASAQWSNYESITDEDLINTSNIIGLTQKLNDGKGLTPRMVITLTKRQKILNNQKDSKTFDQFMGFMNRETLVSDKEPALRELMGKAGLNESQVDDVLGYQKVLIADKKLQDKAAKDASLLQTRKQGRRSLSYEQLVSEGSEVHILAAQEKHKLTDGDVALLRARAKEYKRLDIKWGEDLQWLNFKSLIDNPKLYDIPESEFQEKVRNFSPEMKSDVEKVRDKQKEREFTEKEQESAQARKVAAGNLYGKLSDPKNEEELMKLDLQKLPVEHVFHSDEGYQRWQDLINLQNSIKNINAEVKETAKRDRSNRTFKFLTQGPLADVLLLKTDLTNELQVLNGWEDWEIAELRDRQEILIQKGTDKDNLERLNSDSLAELVRLHKLGDALTEEDLNKNKKLEEDDLKTAISWQSSIRLRKQTIEAARDTEKRNYWKTHYLDDENVLDLINATEETLTSHLGVKTPELAEVLAKRGKESGIRRLPSNQQTYQRNMWKYIQDPQLWSIDIATIQDAFPRFDKDDNEIEGQESRIEKILTKQTQIKEERAKSSELEEKQRIERQPKILSKEYHSKINAVLMNAITTPEGQINYDELTPEDQLDRLRNLSGEITNSITDLDKADFTQLLNYIKTEADALEAEIGESPLYSKDWRPTVTKLFREQIIYTADQIVELNIGPTSLDTDIGTRTVTLRVQAADRRELHKHMKGVFEQNPDWNPDQIEAYLNEYLPKYAKIVHHKVSSITGMDKVVVTPGINKTLEEQIPAEALERINKMTVSDTVKRKMMLIRKKSKQ